MWNEEEFMGWVEIIRSTLRALPGEVWYQDFDYCDEEGIYETPQPTTCVVNDDGDTVANCSDVLTACFVGNARRDLHRLLGGADMFRAQRDECLAEVERLRASLAEALDVLRDVLAVVWDKSLTLRKSDAVDNGHRLLARHEEQSAEIAAVDAELSELEEVNAELDEEEGEK